MLRFDSKKWLKDYVREHVQLGNAYYTAIAAGAALRFDRDDLLKRLKLEDTLLPFAKVSEKLKVENTHPKAWGWCQSLTEEQAEDLVKEASAELSLISADEHCVEDICYARDDAESVITALLYSKHSKSMVKLIDHAHMFDAMFYNVVRGRITTETSTLMESVVHQSPDSYWAYPAWHRSLMDVDLQYRMETIADDWEYLDTVYGREECSAAVQSPGVRAGTTG